MNELQISRAGRVIYTGPSIPPNLLQPGDTIHLGPGSWLAAELSEAAGTTPHITYTSRKLPVPTAEELIRRAGEDWQQRADGQTDPAEGETP